MKDKKNNLIIFTLTAIFLLILCSCQNFLQGNDLKNDINSAIQYSNAKSITVKIIPDSPDYGSIEGNSEHSIKVTDTLNLSFNCADGYFFSKWQAYINGEEDSVGEYVEFSNLTNAKSNATIKKYSENIIIKPECSKYLEITEKFPTWGFIAPCDSNIIITFNSKISEESFYFTDEELKKLGFIDNETNQLASYVTAYKDSKGNCYGYSLYDDDSTVTFKNIHIKNGEENFLCHYKNPELKDNVLTISANKDNPIDFGQSITKNITVTISKNVYSENKVYMTEDKEFSYKINSSSSVTDDTTKPDTIDFYASRNENDFDSNLFFEKTTKEDFDSFTNEQILNNTTGKDFVIEVSATDNQTGISKFYISETFVYKKNGSSVDNPVESEKKTIPVSLYTRSEDGFTASVKTSYTIRGELDGAYLIKVWAEDYNNNISDVLATVVNVTRSVPTSGWKLYNNINNSDALNLSEDDLQNFSIISSEIQLYGTASITLDFKVFCGDSPENINTEIPYSALTKNGEKYNFVYNDTVISGAFGEKATYLKVVVYDSYGNEDCFVQTVPAQTKDLLHYAYKFSGVSSSYWYYRYNCRLNAFPGVKFYCGDVNNGATPCSSVISFEKTYSVNYSGVAYPSSVTSTITSFYESEYGSVFSRTGSVTFAFAGSKYSPGNTESLSIPESLTLEMKAIDTLGKNTIVHVKASEQVKAQDKSTGLEYAGFQIDTSDVSFYFEGTETTVLIPTESLNLENYNLTVIDPTHTGTKGVASQNNVSWYIPDLIEYNEPYELGNRSNYDYTGDYIKITSPGGSVNNTATVYYKTINQKENEVLKANLVELKSKTSGNLFYRREPRILVEKKLLTFEEIEQFEHVDIDLSYPVTDKTWITHWKMPVSQLKDGDYMCFVKFITTDGNTIYGNFAYTKTLSSHVVNDSNLSISGTTVTAALPLTFTDLKTQLARIQINTLSNGSWTKECEQELYRPTAGNSGTYSESGDTAKTFDLGSKSSWMKVYLHEVDYEINLVYTYYRQNTYLFGYSGTNQYYGPEKIYYHAPIYIYPNGKLTPDATCNIKNVIEGAAITILCDNSTLVQTFCAPVNYGEDVEKWEYHTMKENVLNSVEITSSKNYTVPVNEIPSGFYYIVIARFGDGTVLTSSVKQK